MTALFERRTHQKTDSEGSMRRVRERLLAGALFFLPKIPTQARCR